MTKPTEKTCSSCLKEKTTTNFYNDDRYLCIDCERSKARERMASLENKARLAYRTSCITSAKYGSYNDLTYDDVMYLFKLANGRCAYTGMLSDNLSLEHIVPLSKGGANTISNVIVVDLAVNRKKQAGSMMEYVETRYNPYDVQPLVKLLAVRGNRSYIDLYTELEQYQRDECNEEYRRIISKLDERKAKQCKHLTSVS